MRIVVSGLFKHPKTGIYYFRKAIPEKLRAAAGKREWKVSLGTRDSKEALQAVRRENAAFVKMIAQWEDSLAYGAKIDADKIFDSWLAARISANYQRTKNISYIPTSQQALDNVVWGTLELFVYLLRAAWGGKYKDAVYQEMGLIEGHAEVFASLNDDQVDTDWLNIAPCKENDRKSLVERAKVLGRHHRLKALGYQEFAKVALRARDWSAVNGLIFIILEDADIDSSSPSWESAFNRIAERLLDLLATHSFAHVDHDLAAMLNLPDSADPASGILPNGGSQASLPDLLERWHENREKGASKKSYDEWKLAIGRFESIHPGLPVAQITRAHIIKFRDTVAKLPARPHRAVREKSVSEQIEWLKNQKEGSLTSTLSPPSVNKHVAAIRSMLQVAVEDGELQHNPAANVKVRGSRHTGKKRDQLYDADLTKLYAGPLMTDPGACDDETFWFLAVAPFLPIRPGEHAQLTPDDFVIMSGVKCIKVRKGMSEDNRVTKTAKTDTSVREVPLHQTLIAMGFYELATIRKSQGAYWLHPELKTERKYDDRFKILSQHINRTLRKFDILGPKQSFYSTRHNLKFALREAKVRRSTGNELTGHTSSHVGDTYGDGHSIQTLKEDMDKLRYDNINWDPVIECAHARLKRLGLNKYTC